ncbi:MAG TPA: O-antigen ligase family protein [Candidatus Acidoferrales bacterium]|nr:O-antigen ligase family protein [Candidatus Acidoferrales bacterium]
MSVLISRAEAWSVREAAAESTLTGRLVASGVCAVLIVAPLAFGATSRMTALILVAASWCLFLAWLIPGILRGRVPVMGHPMILPALALLAFTAVHWATGISPAPVASEIEWLRWVGYVALAIAAAGSVRTPLRLRTFCSVLAVAGFLIAAMGIAQYLTADGRLYWVWKLESGGRLFGPYVNRNHFGGLMELWCPLALGMAIVPEHRLAQRWFWSVLAVVMGGAVVLSASRGGALSLAVGVVAFALLIAGQRAGKRAVLWLLAAMFVTGGTIVSLDRGELLERYQAVLRPHMFQQEDATSYRFAAWKDTLTLLRETPVAGSGLDTFATRFPAVRSFATDLIWTHAHNDFLQFLAETGVIGGALALWMFVAGGREVAHNLRRTSGTATGALLAAMTAGCIGFLTHGWLDFNFHIPANASSFAVLAAIAAGRDWDES